MGFGNCAREEDKHLRVQFLWHGRPHVATLADQVCSPSLQIVKSRRVFKCGQCLGCNNISDCRFDRLQSLSMLARHNGMSINYIELSCACTGGWHAACQGEACDI